MLDGQTLEELGLTPEDLEMPDDWPAAVEYVHEPD